MNDPGMKKEPYKRLAEINRAITTSLNFDRVLDLIVESASQLVNTTVSVLLLVDHDGLLRIRAARGVDAAVIESFSGGMEEDVIRQLHESLGVMSETFVSVPVIAKNSLDGLLVVARDLPLTEEEEWQLGALTDQAAIALRNARHYEMELAEASRERDETLEALRESNEKVKRILESITDLYYSLDREWRFVDINIVTEKRFGKTRQELIGKVIWDVYPEAAASPLFTNFHKALEEMVPVHFELASKIVPGVWFEAHAYPSDDGLTVYLRDITGRRQAEITNHLLAAIVESSDDAIISKDLNGVISSWNKGAERIFGYKADEVIGRSVTILIPPDRLDEERTILDRLRRGQPVDHFETIRQHKDGSLIDISLTTSPIRDEQGNIFGASKIARDIGETKRREEEARFQAHLLSTVEQAVVATDINGKIIYWNAFAEWLYGWTTAEAVGANVLDLVPALGVRDQAAEIFGRLRKGDSWSGEIRACSKDGTEFPAMGTAAPIFDEDGTLVGMVGVSIDITERKHAEEERARALESERQARNEAEEANRLKDEFLATLSHELRNPLNVILGYTEVLLRSEEANRSQFVRRAAEILKRNALSQSQLVRDLLDLSRLHMGKLSLNQEPVSLTTTIANAVETVRAAAAVKDIDVRIDAPDEVLFVDADPLRMEQVVWNLLNNAVKFTSSGGKVTVRLSRVGDQAKLVVEDTGQGIEPEFLPHVFEMFRQADASSSRHHGGMGIGLALVQELVDLQGGTVAADSAGRNQGAKFTIELPLSRATEEREGPLRKQYDQALKQMKILVVDDSEDTIDMLRQLFEMDGAFVATARSGPEALQIAGEKEFDVILSDISMPGMDGFEFIRRLRDIPRKCDVPVLALTGFGRPEDVERATAEGFFSHVTKPIDFKKLVETLRQLPVWDQKSAARAGDPN
ncbi:MAG: PAS domain S-box protein [Pyrinomonadaceae bacterium]